MMTEVGDRGQFYGEGQSQFYLKFVWQLVKGWILSLMIGRQGKGSPPRAQAAGTKTSTVRN